MRNYSENYGQATELAQMAAQRYDTREMLEQFRNENFEWRRPGKEIEILRDKKGIKNIDISNYLKEHGIKVSDTAVGNWISKDQIPTRDKLIGLCFLFDLTVEKADLFLRKTSFENTFHLRDYKDIIYYYCILNKETIKKSCTDVFSKARELIKIYEPELEKINNIAYYGGSSYTAMCAEQVVKITSEDGLRAFLEDEKNINVLGSFNGSAYSYFADNINDYRDILNKNAHLSQPVDIEDILTDLEDFFFVEGDQEILHKKNTYLSKLSRLFMANREKIEPVFKAVKNKKPIKVSRQILILSRLLLCENGFEDGFEDINMMLSDCGMPLLDPLSAFDFGVMNSLKSDLPIEALEKTVTYLFDLGIGRD